MKPAVQTVLLDVGALVPYEFNPRDNSQAIAAVANSIREFGFLVPIVVDTNNVIVAGHTRYAAIKLLMAEDEAYASAYASVPVIIADHLTEDQLRAFRLIDNKTAEIATWDFGLLAQEIGYLYETGVDFQQFGWSQEEVDCLTAVVSADCLTTASGVEASHGTTKERFEEGVSTGRTQSLSSRSDGSVRILFGDLSFFVMRDDYTAWMTELMKINEFDPTAVISHVADSMGLLAAKLKRDQSVIDGRVSPEAEEVFLGEAAPETAKETIPAAE